MTKKKGSKPPKKNVESPDSIKARLRNGGCTSLPRGKARKKTEWATFKEGLRAAYSRAVEAAKENTKNQSE